MTLSEIAQQLDDLSVGRPIGELQDLRKRLKGFSRRVPGRIFGPQSVFERWAFHLGGRREFQFNIGFEDHGAGDVLRWGLAISLEPSRTLPDVALLFPKITKFNEYLRVYPNAFSNLRMWHFSDGQRSGDYSCSVIPPERCSAGTFVMIGQHAAKSAYDPPAVLDVFDKLLPLYEFVEGDGAAFPRMVPAATPGLHFKPGWKPKKLATQATIAQSQLDVGLRHNFLQPILAELLSKRLGAECVGTEILTGAGTQIDVVAKQRDGTVWFYEIKTDLSARACVRAGLAQLLEYSYWPTASRAARIVIVGEPPLDAETNGFLSALRALDVPIYYSQILPSERILVDPIEVQ